jgi:hypothetical protein
VAEIIGQKLQALQLQYPAVSAAQRQELLEAKRILAGQA